MSASGFVNGKDEKKIVLYALSTCGWCRMTKELLTKLQVAYTYYYLDLLQSEEKEKALNNLIKFNPARSFPTLVINDQQVIVGYDEEKIKAGVL